MPLYDYRCQACGLFEMDAGRDERFVKCACGLDAERRPFSGLPYLKGETMPLQIPDAAYKQEAQRRQLHATWGTAERTVEMMRKNIKTDDQGRKSLDLKAMNAT